MYIESKSGGLIGPARIGRAQFSKTGKTLYYGGREFQSLKGRGFKSNYRDVETGDEYWISGCKKDGSDRLYGERLPIEIDKTSATNTGARSAEIRRGRSSQADTHVRTATSKCKRPLANRTRPPEITIEEGGRTRSSRP